MRAKKRIVGADDLTHFLQYLKVHEHAPVDVAAELIGAQVRAARYKVGHRVGVGVVKLYGIESRFVSAAGSCDKVVDNAVAFFISQFVRLFADAVYRMCDLQPYLAALVMHCGYELLKAFDMIVAAYLKAKPRMDIIGTYARVLGHDETDAGARSVHIVLYSVFGNEAPGSGRVREHRRHYYPVCQLQRFDLDRREKSCLLHRSVILSFLYSLFVSLHLIQHYKTIRTGLPHPENSAEKSVPCTFFVRL